MPRHDASKKCTFCTILHHFPISRNIAKTRHAHRSALKVLQFCSGGVKATFYRVFHQQKAGMCRDMPPYPKIGSKSTFCTIWSYRHQKHPITRVAAPGKLAHFADGMIRQLSVGRLPPQRVHVPRGMPPNPQISSKLPICIPS